MYFNKKNNFFHGIMFHHFHDNDVHLKSQGSIDKDDFFKIINFIGRKNILDADVFYEKLKNNSLKNNEVCLTFDDNLKCQVDIALPVLEELKIKSFFFVYTSIFEENGDNLEVFRFFRTNFFSSIGEFYENFYKVLDKNLEDFFDKNINKINETKIKFPFYTIEDIKFRIIRDIFLNKSQYEEIMFQMIKEKELNHKDLYKKISFQKSDLQTLDDRGHLIGLHTHNHPVLLEKLSYDEQKKEYEQNLLSISTILNKPKNEIKYMSHPCGSYNEHTLQILKELGIELGFKQIMTIEKEKGMKKINNSILEIARQDHSNIFKIMN